MQSVEKIESNLNETFGLFCLEIFNNKRIIENSKTDIDYKSVHKSISDFLKISLDKVWNLPSDNCVKEIIYVMSAFADEIFLNISWEGKQYWENNMLEYQYFKSQIAGEKIFNNINSLMINNEPFSITKAEIYLKTLALGFKGKYRGIDIEQVEINSYRNKLFEFIEKNDKSIFLIDPRLFQKEYTYTIPTIRRILLPDAAIINYVCIFFVFMFLVISSVVWIFETKDIRQLLLDISNIALRE